MTSNADFSIYQDDDPSQHPEQGPSGRFGRYRVASDGAVRRNNDPTPTPSRSPSPSPSPSRRPLQELLQGRASRAKELTRDDRYRCHILRSQYALEGPLTPQKSVPKPSLRKLDEQQ
ncbi:hypothetical protein FOPG_18473 [Fusarium oxysporum f. sp. conglutinans race 2 54008]|uniref:Uncharacterized protein n=1 Tax=Fusarium oxysporum f. sp. conglutinans race 2 54008 TaxID=1089457 RepID=X0GNY5_FUSOX|nr:hypothetical protein FOPG_18473 [Fusarium oxysporum f. sp. conglutinans race 2 54008]